MVNDTYDTLSAALNGLKTKGYVEDQSNRKEGKFNCKASFFWRMYVCMPYSI